LRIVISQRLQRAMPAVRARPGANGCSHPLSRPHGIASRSAPFSWVARVLRKSCISANPPGPGRTP
jgi:hypothetical protein